MNKEWMGFIIACITMVGGFYALVYLPDAKVGVVTPLMTFILGYYFGSSPGSHNKDQTISNLATAQLKQVPMLTTPRPNCDPDLEKKPEPPTS
jgi:hypothetical protein